MPSPSTLDTAERRNLLQAAQLSDLFNLIGWDNLRTKLPVVVDNAVYQLSPVAQKRSVEVYECSPTAGGTLPDRKLRRRIDNELSKIKREHLLIFVNKKRTEQAWVWTNREPGQPIFVRDVPFRQRQSGASLLQILDKIAISVDEESVVTLFEVLERVKDALQKERVTRNFYTQFKTQHDAFLSLVNGVDTDENRRWYTSVMINRIMFLYFVQSKGFLNGQQKFLQEHLALSKKKRGADKYYSDFLCPLFFQGLAKRAGERDEPYKTEFGKIPYLQGSLFTFHKLEEEQNQKRKDGTLPFTIPDAAFKSLFDFFDTYNWHLDERPLADGNNINPDVLGYIFEKYINQRQMGAYYTKEDITEYIGRNTILPFVLDRVREKVTQAFEGAGSVWEKLAERPDDFIFEAVKRGICHEDGTENPLPPYIAEGIADVAKRTRWNETAPATHGLPTEIWREVVARRERYQSVREKMSSGTVRDVRDLITLNLDIRAFAQETLTDTESVDVIAAFWDVLNGIAGKTLPLSVLDPTCGSGAFLFAALKILRPLYAGCLERMEGFVFDADTLGKTEIHRPFRDIIKECKSHSNRDYFLLKKIITQNLFGVDIMEEATEICKLRLFLKLAAQVEPDLAADNLGVEPLPDIDFNIRAGNTLVGAATEKQMHEAFFGKGQLGLQMDENKDAAWREFNATLKTYQHRFENFIQMQTGKQESAKIALDKRLLNAELKTLRDKANHSYALSSYLSLVGVGVDKKKLADFVDSHKPFHWFVEFFGVMKQGGFDVIIGNPPYVEYSKVKGLYTLKAFETESCGNLYAYVVERGRLLNRSNGAIGLIVPMSLTSIREYSFVKKLIQGWYPAHWFTNHAIRPTSLFNGVSQRVSICLGLSTGYTAQTTRYLRTPPDLSHLFSNLTFTSEENVPTIDSIQPKISSLVEASILRKLFDSRNESVAIASGGNNTIYFKDYGETYWVYPLSFEPWLTPVKSYKTIGIKNKADMECLVSTFSSSLFYFFYTAYSDCWHLGTWHLSNFPINLKSLKGDVIRELRELHDQLMRDYQSNRKTRYDKRIAGDLYEYKVSKSKDIIDEIDRVLAKHYGFTPEELDFIINYDIKYRMGRGAEDEAE